MGILPLPQDTIRAIGASQALTDPAAVVKELVDNALDARATNIGIEIHTNTLDLIQVRDNGHGIPPGQDRRLVARRHCTSKITNEKDIRSVGSMMLGFRGEALASAAEMSGNLTVTTRVEGETVAEVLKICRSGEVLESEHVSLPVGTAVKVVDFAKSNPVRRQVLLKNTEKTHKKLKQLLQAYAFARPHVRFSLKLLKAKNDKGSWTYAPKCGGRVEDAAVKVVGAACASQCMWSVVEHRGFHLQAFLPRFNAQINKISHIGSFLSIDARPVSALRGTPAQIVKAFRQSIKTVGPDSQTIKEPFIYLDITCPEGSYDPNIEPRKDDVMFENASDVIDAARKLFGAVYMLPSPASQSDEAHVAQRTSLPETVQTDDNILSNQKQGIDPSFCIADFGSNSAAWNQVSSVSSFQLPEVQVYATGEEAPAKRQRPFRSSMYGCDEDDIDLLDASSGTGRTQTDLEEFREANKDVVISNPWVLAKLNAKVKGPSIEQCQQIVRPDHGGNANVALSHVSDKQLSSMNKGMCGLATPRLSSQGAQQERLDCTDDDLHLSLAGYESIVEKAPWLSPQTSPDPQERLDEQASLRHEQVQLYHNEEHSLQDQSYQSPQGTPLHAIPDHSSRPRRSPAKRTALKNVNKPFTPPTVASRQKEKVWFDHLENQDQSRRLPRTQRHRQQANSNDHLVHQGESSYLVGPPSSLSRSRRNPDIRNFLDVVDLTQDAGTPTQRRQLTPLGPTKEPASSAEAPAYETNLPVISTTPRARDFIPASEDAALRSHTSAQESAAHQTPQQLRTNTRRALRRISGNATSAAVEAGDQDKSNPKGDRSRKPSSRRLSRRQSSSAKKRLSRTKSAQLPLERTPAGEGTHNLALLLMGLTASHVSKLVGESEEGCLEVQWREAAAGAGHSTFSLPFSGVEVREVADALKALLVGKVSDGEMVQDLSELVRVAIEEHAEGVS